MRTSSRSAENTTPVHGGGGLPRDRTTFGTVVQRRQYDRFWRGVAATAELQL